MTYTNEFTSTRWHPRAMRVALDIQGYFLPYPQSVMLAGTCGLVFPARKAHNHPQRAVQKTTVFQTLPMLPGMPPEMVVDTNPRTF